MKLIRGFGKNYFSLSAIQAYSTATTMHSQISSINSHFHKKIFIEDEELDDSESPPEILEQNFILNNKPCHCNCYYNLKTKLMLLLNVYIPRCPYYTTYFAFRRTGVHPPIYY
jgi:hypothetical protein